MHGYARNRTEDIRRHAETHRKICWILLLEPSSLIKREFKDIFQKNDLSFDSENPT